MEIESEENDQQERTLKTMNNTSYSRNPHLYNSGKFYFFNFVFN